MGDTQRVQKFTFFWRASCCENLRTLALSQLYGRKSDAAGGRVNEHALATAQLRETIETVMSGQKGNWHAGCILYINCIGQGCNERRRDGHFTGKAFRCKSKDTVPHFKFSGGCPDFGNDSGTFCAQRKIRAWIHA